MAFLNIKILFFRMMRRISLKLLFLVMCCLALMYLFKKINNFTTDKEIFTQLFSGDMRDLRSAKHKFKNETISSHNISEKEEIVVSFVVCDSRFNESLNVVKSALLFSRSRLHFVIFTDDTLLDQFDKQLKIWQKLTTNPMTFELHRINFPEEHREVWLNLFRKCAAQRLFLPKLLPHISAMIYVDTDTLFLGPVEELWDHFYQFNSSQISAMAVEDDNPNVSWYFRFAIHPFYGKYGLNTGMMLMNLTRMRDFGWTDYVTPIMLKWKLHIPWGDQDIINIIFHYHPRAVFVLPCRYNYRSDQCMYGDSCAAAAARGVFLLHGSRKAFHTNKQPAFQAVYQAIDEYKLGTDPLKTLLPNMERYLFEAEPSNCGNLKQAFLRVPKDVLGGIYSVLDRNLSTSVLQ